MSAGLNKLRKTFAIIFDKRKTEITITEWKLIAGAFKAMAELIEDNGYYPNISQREWMIEWLIRYTKSEGKRIKG